VSDAPKKLSVHRVMSSRNHGIQIKDTCPESRVLQ
jgi:hypothetical protein